MPLLLTISCFSKIQICFTFLVLAHPGSPGKRAVKRVCVCVCEQSNCLSRLNREMASEAAWDVASMLTTYSGSSDRALCSTACHRTTWPLHVTWRRHASTWRHRCNYSEEPMNVVEATRHHACRRMSQVKCVAELMQRSTKTRCIVGPIELTVRIHTHAPQSLTHICLLNQETTVMLCVKTKKYNIRIHRESKNLKSKPSKSGQLTHPLSGRKCQ